MASSTMDFDAVPDSMVIPAELEVKRSGVSTKNGVWCKRSIPKGVKYGPFKGEKKKKSQVTNPDYMWEIRTGKGWFCVDASDPSKGNWMRYVNSARYFEEQNIVALQQHQRIYYKTIKEIKPGEELLCWFNSADTAQQELAMEHAGKPKAKKKSKSSKIFGKVVKKRKGKQGKGGMAAATSIKSSSSQEDLTADTSVEETTLDESEAKTDDSQEADTGTELSEETTEETSMDQESETPDEDDLPIAVLQKQQQATPRKKKKEEEETSDDEKLVIDEEGSGDAKDAESEKDSESAKHVSPKPFPCTQCGRNFSTKQGLERHLRTHSGEKPYKCSHCGKQFTTSTNMRRHERLHTGDRPHMCQECDHAFIQKGDLKKHMVSQHGKVEADSVEESEKDGQENGSSPQSSVCLNKSNEHPESSKEPIATPTKDGQSDAEKEPEDEPSGDMMSEIVGDADKQELDDENEMEEEEGKTGKFICEICNKRFTKYPNMTRHRKLAHERDQIIRKKKILVEELLEEGERPKKRKRVSQGDSPRSRSSTPGAHPGKGEDAAQYLDGRLEQKEHQHIGKLSPKRIVDGSSSKKKSPVRSGGNTVKIHVPRAVRPPMGTPGRGPRHGKSSGMHPGAVSPYTQVHPGSSQQGAAAVHITSPPYGSPQYVSGKGRRMLEPPPAHSGPLVPPHQSSSNRRTDSPPLRSPTAKQSQSHRDQQLSRMLHPESRGRDRAPPNVVVGDQQLSPMHRQKQRARAPAPPNVVMAQRASFLARGAAGAGPRKGVPSPHARNMAAPQQEHPKQSTSRTPTIAQVAKHSPALQKMYAASFPDRMVSPSQNIRSQQLSYLASRVGTVHHGSNAKGSFGQSTPTLQQFQSSPSNQYSSSSQGAKMPSAFWSKGKSRDTQPYRMKSSPELYSHMVESDQPLDLSAPLKKVVKEELVFTDDGVLDLSGKKQVDRPPAHTARQQSSSLDLSDASSVASYISRVPQYEKASSYVSGSSPANAAAGRSASPTFGLGNLFKCNVCHTPFKSMKDMNQHVSAHAKEWPFKCEFCIQLFKVSSELSQHRASLHGVSKTFMCSLCNREFGFLGNLQNHQRDVHPNMPCSYTVLQPGALRPQNFTDPSKSTPKKEELKRQTEFGSLIQSPKKDQMDGKGKISPVKPVDTSQDIKRNFAGYAMNIINPENPFNRPPQLQTSLYNSAIKCTKCGATFESMPNLHMHIIDCAEGKKTSPGPSPVKKGAPKKAAHGSLVKKLGEPHKLTDGEMAAIKIKKKAKNLSKLNEKRKKAQQFQISYDPKKYTGRRRLATEMLDLHKCPGCQKNFSHFSNLQRHLLVCPGKDKIDKDVLDAHLGALKEDEKSRELKEQHMCSNCKRSFTYLASLRKHQQSCDKKFAAAAEGRADAANAGVAVPGLKKKRSKGRKLAPVDGESTEDSMLEMSETEDTGLEEYGETFEEGNAPPTKKKRVIGWKGGRRKKRNFWWKKKRSQMKGEDGMEEADSQGNGESSQILNIMRSMSDELQSPTEQPEGAPFGNGGEPLIQGEEEAGMPGPGGDYNEEMKVFDAIEGIAKKVSGGKESSTKAGAGKNNGANSNNNNNNARGNRVVRTNVPSASTAKVEVGQGDGATGAAAKPSTSQGPFICGDCGSEFRAKCHLVRHSSVHMNRPYKCKICHHSFAAQHNFENHMRLRHKNVTVKVEKS